MFSNPMEATMTEALEPVTGILTHISKATRGKAYQCRHCEGRVFSTEFAGGNWAYRHSKVDDCIGRNTPRCDSWTPPPGYERPASS
jgi:hypothetical protein